MSHPIEYVMATPTSKIEVDKCVCSLRIKLVGDGCQYCNPELHERYIAEALEDEDDNAL